jgi:glycosyltransferase involved in cell wall biosynthesis
MNVLALSYLFPNRAQPAYGIFVLNRLRAVREFCNIKVIAPVQWYPLIKLVRRNLWGAAVPHFDELDGLEVYHPRFAVIPRYLKWFDAISYFWATRSIVRKLRRGAFDFDLIDAHWTYPDIVAAYWVARAAGKKFGVTVRGHEALYQEEHTLRRRMVEHYLRKADFVVALSAELRDRVIGLGVAAERVHVVLNGVDLGNFHFLDKAECRARLGLPVDARIVISVGRLTEGKGHQDLIRAVAELAAERPVRLYIIGGVNPEDDFRSVLESLIAELGLREVYLLDRIAHDQLACWYAAADVFCLASKREGCPNVVLEALACGTPVVATDVGAIAEVVVPGKNGVLVGPGRDGSLADALRTALGHSWDRSSIAAGMTRWGWTRCGEQVFELYRSVLRGTS